LAVNFFAMQAQNDLSLSQLERGIIKPMKYAKRRATHRLAVFTATHEA